jgi:hypothetical protein
LYEKVTALEKSLQGVEPSLAANSVAPSGGNSALGSELARIVSWPIYIYIYIFPTFYNLWA